MILHAGLMAIYENRRWRGVLISGPSGTGKSDLALRMIEAGWRLVADDRTLVWTSGGELFGRAPEPLAGKIEARGLGVVSEPALPYCAIHLSVADGVPERLPQAAQSTHLGLGLSHLVLPLLEVSSVAKISRAMR